MIFFVHKLVLLTRSVTLIKEIMISQFVNILRTSNSQISSLPNGFRSGISFLGALEEVNYCVTQLTELRLCSLPERFQGVC